MFGDIYTIPKYSTLTFDLFGDEAKRERDKYKTWLADILHAFDTCAPSTLNSHVLPQHPAIASWWKGHKASVEAEKKAKQEAEAREREARRKANAAEAEALQRQIDALQRRKAELTADAGTARG